MPLADKEVSWPGDAQKEGGQVEESEGKKVFENLKRLLMCASLEAENAFTVARSMGEGCEAKVRILEELLRATERERDEVREECRDLRERLAAALNSAGGGGSVNIVSEDHTLHIHHQVNLARKRRNNLPRVRSLERVPSSLQPELHAKKLNDIRLHHKSKDGDNLPLLPTTPRHNSPDAQSSLSSSLQTDVHPVDESHSFMLEQPHPLAHDHSSGTASSLSMGHLQGHNSLDLHHMLQPQELSQGHQHMHVQEQQQEQQQLRFQEPLHQQQQQQQEPHVSMRLQELEPNLILSHSSYDSSSSLVLPPVTGDILATSCMGNNGAFGESASNCSLLRQRQLHLPEPPEADMQVMLKCLPEKGKLLQAVMRAGPLLQNLMLAGPLPQWRHPPPPVATVEIPKVAMPSGVSTSISLDQQQTSAATQTLSSSYGKSV